MGMKIADEQLEQLELYLESKKLYQSDIKLEVLDHMASSITDTMQKEHMSFINAFEIEQNKWDIELGQSYSFWIGAMYTYPKIVIGKMVQITKKLYLKTILMSLFLLILAYMFRNTIEISKTIADKTIGYSYLIFGLGIIFMHFRIRKSKMNTTFKQVFKIHVIPCVI